jgi:hypothetical protein
MVAKIDTNNRLDKSLNYNEQKVAQDDARLILVSGFLKEKEQLNFYEKMERLERYNTLNDRSAVNTLHAKISFDPSEKETLTDEKMAKIAERYMEGIGFKDQPYLVYRHVDTAVPHMHIVSTLIDKEGDRIRDYKIGELKSEPTRQAIEVEFGLVKANDHALREEFRLRPVDLEKITLGEKPTKQAIQNNLMIVFKEWKVTSLSELNAVLRPLNIVADPGQPGTRTRAHQGLTYKVIDENGKTAGVPINASDFYFKPTLKNLAEKFSADKQHRGEELEAVRDKIEVAFARQPKSLEALVKLLKGDNLDLMVWRGKQGEVYGLTYVDQENKVAVKGSDLGDGFSASAIEHRLRSITNEAGDLQVSKQEKDVSQGAEQRDSQTSNKGQTPDKVESATPTKDKQEQFSFRQTDNLPEVNLKVPQLLSSLMKSERGGEDLPKELKRDKRQRRRKHL